MTDPTIFSQYANVFIPLAISIVGGIVTFYVYKEKVNNLVSDMKDAKTELKEVRDKVISCETALFKEALTRRKSPVELTEKGEEVLNVSGGKKFIDDNYEELKQMVINKNPKNSYDKQEYSKEVIKEIEKDERLNNIKEYLFKVGREFEGIVEVLGIYLRNKILDEQEIPRTDIDKDDPSKINKNEEN